MRGLWEAVRDVEGPVRAHAERRWRGINPPRRIPQVIGAIDRRLSEEDLEIAACLVMLANGGGKGSTNPLERRKKGKPRNRKGNKATNGEEINLSPHAIELLALYMYGSQSHLTIEPIQKHPHHIRASLIWVFEDP
ncbi:Zinc finger protein ZAT3 [Acorus calamus]|uniref:Zinc finger protein ZAT3 n=1 Tax=Acorus calamus TaxID=4465 RepID=A0AAV9FIV2_ACOCL|nr:Zinc finger protein ZAT3 [Acorus calamus]